MTIITQAEFEVQYIEWVRKQTPPNDEQERIYWYVEKRFEFDKKLRDEGINRKPGFWVDNLGKAHYDDK